MPTSRPRLRSASARLTESDDLPTPPLPEATAITRVRGSTERPFVAGFSPPVSRVLSEARCCSSMCEKRTSTRPTPAHGRRVVADLALEVLLERAAGHRQDDLDQHVAAVDDDLAEHPELDHVAAQLGIDDPAHGLADRCVGRCAHAGIVSAVAAGPYGASGWNTSPSSSFGKKYVDFCGIVSPAAATASTSATVGARSSSATALPAGSAATASAASAARRR